MDKSKAIICEDNLRISVLSKSFNSYSMEKYNIETQSFIDSIKRKDSILIIDSLFDIIYSEPRAEVDAKLSYCKNQVNTREYLKNSIYSASHRLQSNMLFVFKNNNKARSIENKVFPFFNQHANIQQLSLGKIETKLYNLLKRIK